MKSNFLNKNFHSNNGKVLSRNVFPKSLKSCHWLVTKRQAKQKSDVDKWIFIRAISARECFVVENFIQPVSRSYDDAFAARRVRDYNEETLSCFSPLIKRMKFTSRLRLLIRMSMSRERDVSNNAITSKQNCNLHLYGIMMTLIAFE